MNIQDCILHNKYDLQAIENARAVGFPQLSAVLPDLLEWLQDANWPVVRPTASVLLQAGTEIAPHIKTVLNGDDSIWKYWTIDLLMRDLNPEAFCKVERDIMLLSQAPTEADKLEEVDALATWVLANWHL